MILHIPSEANAQAERATLVGVSATVTSLSKARTQRREKEDSALIAQIIESVQHIDVVRLFEFAAEREAKSQGRHT